MLAPIERALEKALESPIKKMKEFLGIHKETADSPSRKGLLKSLTGLIVTGLEEGLCDYGPPYEYDEYFDGALLFETSQPNCSASAVHGLLNCKVDPNDVDRDDLCFTPMHYCARHCHLIAMRMLIKAKAHVNVLNEFGQTPLIVCVMIEQSLNNQSTQVHHTTITMGCPTRPRGQRHRACSTSLCFSFPRFAACAVGDDGVFTRQGRLRGRAR
jgi:hypothetical protein